MKVIYVICMVLMCMACQKKEVAGQTEIEWDQGMGDFIFLTNWSYPEGIYRNDFGQLSCDGFCPERTDAMKDSTGRIFDDSISAFYALVDTTHRFYTLYSDAQCVEYAGADYMIAKRQHDTVVCYSLCNAATHCSLNLKIVKNTCIASLEIHSITGKDTTYVMQDGFMKIDPALWEKGILKGAFDMTFNEDIKSSKYVYWRGLIYTKILNSGKE
jgi:hypothetical protein